MWFFSCPLVLRVVFFGVNLNTLLVSPFVFSDGFPPNLRALFRGYLLLFYTSILSSSYIFAIR